MKLCGWIGCLLAIASSLQGEESLQNEVLTINEGVVHVVSSFAEIDYFSTFSEKGEFLWEIPFKSKISSWKKEGDKLFIFSQMRGGAAFFLSCVDLRNGAVLWEKGIFAPSGPAGESAP
jgi:hypothetical protein